MNGKARQRWKGLFGHLRTLVPLALLVAGCASSKSVELATQTTHAIGTYSYEVDRAVQDALARIAELRDYEESQWNALIAIVDSALGEYDKTFKALKEEDPPEFLDNVSNQTQEAYCEIRTARENLNRLIARCASQAVSLAEMEEKAKDALATAKKATPAENELKTAKAHLSEVYRLLQSGTVLPSAKSLKPPDQYRDTAAEIQTLASSYLKEVQGQVTYYRQWKAEFEDRLAQVDVKIATLGEKVEELKAEKARLVSRKGDFLSAVDDVVKELRATGQSLTAQGQRAIGMARALEESIRHDVQIAHIATVAVDMAVRATTGLSIAGLISERDGKRISTLINTGGQMLGIAYGTAVEANGRLAEDTKKMESGSQA